MKKRVLALSVAALLGGCDIPIQKMDDDQNLTKEYIKNQTEVQEESQKSSTKLTEKDLNYKVRASCAYYDMFYDVVDNKSWFYTYGNSADFQKLYLIDDSTEVLSSIKPDAGHIKSTGINEFVKRESDTEKFLRSHKEDNLLHTCTYRDEKANKEQVFHQIVSLSDDNLWKKAVRYYNGPLVENNLLLHTSMLTDLHYKIYKKIYAYRNNKEEALKEADNFMRKAFEGSVYKEADYLKYKGTFFDSIPIVDAKKSKQAQYYKKLNNLAWRYTDKRVDLLNDIIAENYEAFYLSNEGCIDEWVCSSIFPDATSYLIKDPKFNEGLRHWEQNENLYDDTLGSITTSLISTNPRKHNIKLYMWSDHGESDHTSSAEIYQTYHLQNPQEVNDIVFKIKSKKLLGTAYPFGGFIFNSGLAGYYACFNDSFGNALGCMIVADYDDPITLPILIGEMFKVESSQDYYIVKGVRDNFEDSFNLGKIIKEHLPSVKKRFNQLSSITVGAFVSEAKPNSSCIKCEAKVEAEMISLEKL